MQTKAELDALQLVRVHENFRVIAVGVPVPPFPGNPLDPPLRSRFQVRSLLANRSPNPKTEPKPWSYALSPRSKTRTALTLLLPPVLPVPSPASCRPLLPAVGRQWSPPRRPPARCAVLFDGRPGAPSAPVRR
jgi:hypothetical protein